VANKVGLSEDSIILYVSGKIPKADILHQRAQLCGVSMDYLISSKWRVGKSGGPLMITEAKAPYSTNQPTSEERELLELLQDNPELRCIIKQYAHSKRV